MLTRLLAVRVEKDRLNTITRICDLMLPCLTKANGRHPLIPSIEVLDSVEEEQSDSNSASDERAGEG
jgi:hypothetical protein